MSTQKITTSLFQMAHDEWYAAAGRAELCSPVEAMARVTTRILDGYRNLGEAEDAWESICEATPGEFDPFVGFTALGEEIRASALRQAIDFVGDRAADDSRWDYLI